jgi:hypothetical protein
MRAYDVETQAFGLSELTEESDGEPGPTYKKSDDVERASHQPTKHDER